MRFAFHLKMTGRNGAPVQLIIGERPASSVEAIAAELNRQDFIVIDELLRRDGDMIAAGPIAIHQNTIGKVKEWRDHSAED